MYLALMQWQVKTWSSDSSNQPIGFIEYELLPFSWLQSLTNLYRKVGNRS